MHYEYSKAEVKTRTKPQHMAELSRYLRTEYGPGTEPGYFFAELAGKTREARRGKRARKGVLNTLARAAKNLFKNSRKAESKSPEPTR